MYVECTTVVSRCVLNLHDMVFGGLIAVRLLVELEGLLELGAVVDHAGPPGEAGELDPDEATTPVLHAHQLRVARHVLALTLPALIRRHVLGLSIIICL